MILVVQYPTKQDGKAKSLQMNGSHLGKLISEETVVKTTMVLTPAHQKNALLSTGFYEDSKIQVDSFQLSATKFQVKNK